MLLTVATQPPFAHLAAVPLSSHRAVVSVLLTVAAPAPASTARRRASLRACSSSPTTPPRLAARLLLRLLAPSASPGAMGRGQQRQHAASSSSTNKPRRNRASPSRLVKLYKDLTPSQRKRIEMIDFGGLLKIACETLPADFANWLMVECFDADSSELVFPGRGRISVNADSVCSVLGLPNKGDEVKYELDVDAINFIHEEYGIGEGTSPRIESILGRLTKNRDKQ